MCSETGDALADVMLEWNVCYKRRCTSRFYWHVRRFHGQERKTLIVDVYELVSIHFPPMSVAVRTCERKECEVKSRFPLVCHIRNVTTRLKYFRTTIRCKPICQTISVGRQL